MIDGPNLYTYCGNDPVNLVDPWGWCGEKERVGWWEKLQPFLIGSVQWHPDYNKVGEKFLEIFYKGGKYRFNSLGELVEHTGKIIGKATGKAAEALKYLKNVKPDFFLKLPVIIIIIPPELKGEPNSPFYDSELGGGAI